MSTEFVNEPTPRKEVKDNRNLIYGVLIGALLLTWGYIIYDKSKSGEQIDSLTSQNTQVTSERDEIQAEYSLSLARLDSLMGENQNLTDSLTTQSSEITKMKREISNILNNKNATARDLAKARTMIKSLNGEIEGLAAEVSRLNEENQVLVASNTRLTEEKTQVEQTLVATATNRDSIQRVYTETVDVASTLSASNFNMTPINVKNSGKEKTTTSASRVDKMRITFQLNENRVAPSGEKQLFIAVTGPDGKPIIDATNGSGQIATKDNGDHFYTNKVVVNYDNSRKVPVSFDWSSKNNFQQGNYKIEVFHNGYKIGETTTTLKKGGLFS